MYNLEDDAFEPIVFNSKISYNEINKRYSKGIQSLSEYNLALVKYNRCVIDVPMPPIYKLFLNEVLNPFYIF